MSDKKSKHHHRKGSTEEADSYFTKKAEKYREKHDALKAALTKLMDKYDSPDLPAIKKQLHMISKSLKAIENDEVEGDPEDSIKHISSDLRKISKKIDQLTEELSKPPPEPEKSESSEEEDDEEEDDEEEEEEEKPKKSIKNKHKKRSIEEDNTWGRTVSGDPENPTENIWVKNRLNIMNLIETNREGKREDDTLTIPPQVLTNYPVNMKKNQICAWLWNSQKQSFLSFHLYFFYQDKDDNVHNDDVMRYNRLIWTRYGMFKAPCNGQLIFMWDNKLSFKKEKVIDIYTLIFKSDEGEEYYNEYLQREEKKKKELQKHLSPFEVEGGILYCDVCCCEPTDEGTSYTIHCEWTGKIEGHCEWYITSTYDQYQELEIDLFDHYAKKCAKLPDFPASVLIPTNDTHISRKHTFNEWLQGVMSIPKLAGSYEVNYLLSYKEHIRLAQRKICDNNDRLKEVESRSKTLIEDPATPKIVPEAPPDAEDPLSYLLD